MSTQILNTRIINKHVTWDQATTGTWIPYEGEIVLAKVDVKKTDPSTGVVLTVPTFLQKVGDGTNQIKDLPWLHAPASDVYTWAKQSKLSITDTDTGNVITGITSDENGITITRETVALSSELGAANETIEALQAALEAEKTARSDADTALSGRITALESFKTTHENTNYVESVVAGNGISVTGGDTENVTVAVKVDDSAATSGKTKVELSTSDSGLKAEVDLSAYNTAEESDAAYMPIGKTFTTTDLTNWDTTIKNINDNIADAKAAGTTAQQSLTDHINDVSSILDKVDTTNGVTAAITAAVNAEADLRQAADTALEGRVGILENDVGILKDKIVGVTGAMHFAGVSSTDPGKGPATVGGKSYTPSEGDVVIYKAPEVKDTDGTTVLTPAHDIEYVYDGSGWVELGDVTAEQKRISELEEKVGNDTVANQIKTEKESREAADKAITDKIGTVADDTTVVDMISDAQSAAETKAQGSLDAYKLEVDAALGGKVDNDALNNYYTKTEVYTKTEANTEFINEDELTAAINAHKTVTDAHGIENIAGLQSALDSKSDTEHNHNITELAGYSGVNDAIIAAKTSGDNAQSDLNMFKTTVSSSYETIENVNAYKDQVRANYARVENDTLMFGDHVIIFDCGGVETA